MSEAQEFGGYFQLERSRGSLYHEDALFLNSARNALAFLIESRCIGRLWVPDYICDSVPAVCRRSGIDISYYEIGEDLLPRCLPDLAENEWLYLVNYFGRISDVDIRRVALELQRIIVDNAQAFFTPPLQGIDTLYSCRKFFGVADGAYLYTESEIDRVLPRAQSSRWMTHVLGRAETSGAEHYAKYRESERRLVDEPVSRMSAVTESLLRGIDYEEAARCRHRNQRVLESRLGHLNLLRPTPVEGPFSYPLLLDGGHELRPQLHARKVFIPLLWPNVLSDWPEEIFAHRFARDLLPIPLDQRYTEQEMHVLADIVEEVVAA